MRATIKDMEGVSVIRGVNITLREGVERRSGLGHAEGFFRSPSVMEASSYLIQLEDGRSGGIIITLVQNFYDCYFKVNGTLSKPEPPPDA